MNALLNIWHCLQKHDVVFNLITPKNTRDHLDFLKRH